MKIFQNILIDVLFKTTAPRGIVLNECYPVLNTEPATQIDK